MRGDSEWVIGWPNTAWWDSDMAAPCAWNVGVRRRRPCRRVADPSVLPGPVDSVRWRPRGRGLGSHRSCASWMGAAPPDALAVAPTYGASSRSQRRSEEHTSDLQSLM